MGNPNAGGVARRTRRIWPGLVGGVALLVASLMIAVTTMALRSSPATPVVALPLTGRWVPTSLRADSTALLPLPQQPTTILAATTTGVWRSTDAGATWLQDGSGLRGRGVFVLAGTPDDDAVWAGSFDGTVYMRTAAGGQVTWRRISPVLRTDPSYGVVPIYSLAVLSLKGHPLLVGSMGAIFRGDPSSAGRAWRWQRVWPRPSAGQGGPGGAPGCFGGCSSSASEANVSSGGGAVTSLLAAPWDAHRIFSSIFEASPPVLVSHDDGRTWVPDGSNLPALLPVQDLAPGDRQLQQVFLTTMGGGVWQREADDSWQDISAGLPQRHAMPLIAAQPEAAGVLYAGTMASGVYERVGRSAWRPLGRGLTGAAATVSGLAATPGGHPILLAATAAGVFRYLPQGSF